MSVELKSNVVNFSHAQAAKFGQAPAAQALRFSSIDSVNFGNTVKFGQGAEEKAPEVKMEKNYFNKDWTKQWWNPFRPLGAVIYSAVAAAITIPLAGVGGLAVLPLWLIGYLAAGKVPVETTPETPNTDAAATTGAEPAPDAKPATEKAAPAAADKDKSAVVKEAKTEITYTGAKSVTEAYDRLMDLISQLEEFGLNDTQVKTLADTASNEVVKVVNGREFRPIRTLFEKVTKGFDKLTAPTDATRSLATAADSLLEHGEKTLASRTEVLEQVTRPVAKLEHVVTVLQDNDYKGLLQDLAEQINLPSADLPETRDDLNQHFIDALTPSVELSHELGLLAANELKAPSAAKQLLTIAKTQLDDQIKAVVNKANAATEAEAKTRGEKLKTDYPKKPYPYTVQFTTFKLDQKPATSKAEPEVTLDVNDKKKMEFRKNGTKILP